MSDELIDELISAARNCESAQEWGENIYGAQKQLERAKEELSARIAELEAQLSEARAEVKRIKGIIQVIEAQFDEAIYQGLA